jgi:hypothetical protein
MQNRSPLKTLIATLEKAQLETLDTVYLPMAIKMVKTFEPVVIAQLNSAKQEGIRIGLERALEIYETSENESATN